MKAQRRLMFVLTTALLVLLGLAGITLAAPSLLKPVVGPNASYADGSWSSDWVDIQAGETIPFTHDIGGEPALYAVDLWFRDTRAGGLGIHHRAYGGMDVAGQRHGVFWHELTDSSISVTRMGDDLGAAQVLLRIWVPDPPDYDSDWMDIQLGEILTLTHGLGGEAGDYTVGLIFRDTVGTLGTHQYAFGGLEVGGQYQGAGWQNLTASTVEVLRFGGDTTVHQVRLFIRRPDEPNYDSEWTDVARNETQAFAHGLGGNPNRYVVRISARSVALGINARTAGGMEAGGHFFGANWQNLTDSAISVFRRAHDASAEQVRVRIWTDEEEVLPWETWSNGNYVNDLSMGDGVIWASTDGGAVKWDPSTGDYTKYITSDGLGDGGVWSSTSDGSGVTWFSTAGGGLAAFDGSEWTVFTTEDGLRGNTVRAIALQNGVKWIATTSGLNAFDDGGTPHDKSDDTWTGFSTADGLGYPYVYDVALDASGLKWMATYGGGICVLDDGGTPHDKTDDNWETFSEEDGLVYRGTWSLAIDQHDRVWICTTKGLGLLDPGGTPFDKSDDSWAAFTTVDGLANDSLRQVALDSAGRAWIGTAGGGVSVLNPGTTPFDKRDDTWTTFSTSDGLAGQYVYAVLLDDPANQVWLGTGGEGISRLAYAGTVEDKSDDTWTLFATDDPMPADYVRAVLAEGDHVWAATYDGLAVTNGISWTTYAHSDGLGSKYVYDLVAQDGLLWAGTAGALNAFDDGGTPYDGSDDTWTAFRAGDGLSSDCVQNIALDGDGQKWVITCGHELNVLDDGGSPHDKSDDQWHTYTGTESLDWGWVYDLTVDDEDHLWIGTNIGLFVLDFADTPFDEADDTWGTFTVADGLASDYVNAVVPGPGGQVWAGTSQGLCVLDHGATPFDKTDDTWTTFQTGDGLVWNSVQDIALDVLGRIWVATAEGLSVLDTDGTPHDKSDDTYVQWGTSDGLADDTLTTISINREGTVWVGTEAGLSRMTGAVECMLYLPLVEKG